MEKRELATNLELIVQENGIAEIVFGPEGGMPATDKQGHAVLGHIWRELSADSRVRCILVHSRGKGFCAGGTPDVVQGMLDSETERLRVMPPHLCNLNGFAPRSKANILPPFQEIISSHHPATGLGIAEFYHLQLSLGWTLWTGPSRTHRG